MGIDCCSGTMRRAARCRHAAERSGGGPGSQRGPRSICFATPSPLAPAATGRGGVGEGCRASRDGYWMLTNRVASENFEQLRFKLSYSTERTGAPRDMAEGYSDTTFNLTLIEALRSFVIARHDNWDQFCLRRARWRPVHSLCSGNVS